MIHPIFCYIFLAFSFSTSLFLCIDGKVRAENFFYLPIWLMIGLYTIHAIITDKQKYTPRTFRQALPKALGKYIMWALILLGVISIYKHHPLYRDFAVHTRRFFEDYFRVYLALGFPYHLLAEKYRHCPDNVMGDPYLRVVSLLKCLLRGRFRQALHRLKRPGYKRLYMGALLRIHYIPIMVEQVYYGMVSLTKFARNPQFTWSLSAFVVISVSLAWLIDSNNGAMGYFWESRFSKTRFRAVDLNPLHWIVVLMCYMPFIRYASEFVPFPSPHTNTPQLFSSPAFNIGIEVTLMVLVVLYMLSGAALAFSTSNLSYKKIQTKGPYAVVRHPATAFKLTYFALAFFRYRSACNLLGLSLFLFWMGVYVSRALIEEDFLKRFSEYREYMKKTRYRFIPGLC